MGDKDLRKQRIESTMSGRKELSKEAPGKLGSSFSRPLIMGAFCFLFWLLFFISTGVYSSNIFGFGSSEIRALGIFRSRLRSADMSAYTFESGLGMSFYRVLLSGFGGILMIPFSLLPESIHPDVAAYLDALRLGISSAVIFYLTQSGKKERTYRFSIMAGAAYTAVVLLLALLLRFPVADTFFLFPILLKYLLSEEKKADKKNMPGGKKNAEKKDAEKAPFRWDFSLSFFLLLAATFLCCAAWDVIVIPAVVVILLIRILRKKVVSKVQLIHAALALGCCAFLLLPQFLQLPCAVKGEPAAAWLQELGNDTDKFHTDVTFHSDATEKLLNRTHSMLIVNKQTAPSDIPADAVSGATAEVLRPASEYDSLFAFYNEWFYTLWPSLPILPFQDTTCTGPTYLNTNNVMFTMSTMFTDSLYCEVILPRRDHPVDVLVNDSLITTISGSPEPVLIELGTYNVGQTINLRLRSAYPDELKEASAKFGYLNTLNWSLYTENANFGILSLEEDADGITAEAIAATDSTLLTNIPYEKGWSLYLNGEKTPVYAYRDAWLASDFPSGNSLIHLHYTAPGSTLGGWISGLSFILLAVLVSLPLRRKNRK